MQASRMSGTRTGKYRDPVSSRMTTMQYATPLVRGFALCRLGGRYRSGNREGLLVLSMEEVASCEVCTRTPRPYLTTLPWPAHSEHFRFWCNGHARPQMAHLSRRRVHTYGEKGHFKRASSYCKKIVRDYTAGGSIPQLFLSLNLALQCITY